MFLGHRRTDCYKAVSPGAEREKQREMVSGDPDHEEVSFTVTHINGMKVLFVSLYISYYLFDIFNLLCLLSTLPKRLTQAFSCSQSGLCSGH